MKEPQTAMGLIQPDLKSDKDVRGSIHHQEDANALPLETTEERDARIAGRATLQNALHGISKIRLFAEVDQFCKDHNLQEHQEIFRKGALLAQRPDDWALLDDLSDDEKAAAKYERDHK
jgi:hypothetical protein